MASGPHQVRRIDSCSKVEGDQPTEDYGRHHIDSSHPMTSRCQSINHPIRQTSLSSLKPSGTQTILESRLFAPITNRSYTRDPPPSKLTWWVAENLGIRHTTISHVCRTSYQKSVNSHRSATLHPNGGGLNAHQVWRCGTAMERRLMARRTPNPPHVRSFVSVIRNTSGMNHYDPLSFSRPL